MNNEISILNFFQSGELGPLHVGLTYLDVISLLGSPDQRSMNNFPKIIKYGNVQLTFKQDILSMIVVSFNEAACSENSSFVINDKFIRAGISYDKFIQFFATDLGLLKQDDNLTFDQQCVVRVVHSGVELLFVDDKLDKACKRLDNKQPCVK